MRGGRWSCEWRVVSPSQGRRTCRVLLEQARQLDEAPADVAEVAVALRERQQSLRLRRGEGRFK